MNIKYIIIFYIGIDTLNIKKLDNTFDSLKSKINYIVNQSFEHEKFEKFNNINDVFFFNNNIIKLILEEIDKNKYEIFEFINHQDISQPEENKGTQK